MGSPGMSELPYLLILLVGVSIFVWYIKEILP